MKAESSDEIKQQIKELIDSFIASYMEKPEIHTKWGEPLIGYADALDPYIQALPKTISETHGLPQEILPDAKTVLVYYVPFTRELAKTNQTGTYYSSPDWALAYEETNAMFGKMNAAIISFLESKGYKGRVAPQTATFDQDELISDWSHRHFAYAAGLGTFGINNMLLTEKGCCGRFFTIVTDLPVETGHPMEEELCLYKAKGTCGICMRNCPAGALTPGGYDRKKCYAILRKNAEKYTMFGSSYSDENGEANSVGSEVCGKCVTQSPCAIWNRKLK